MPRSQAVAATEGATAALRIGAPAAVQAAPGGVVRVVHLTTRLIVAGMENVVASLIRAMPARSYRSALWCLEAADVQGRELRDAGFDVHEFDKRRSRDPWLFERIASRLRRDRVDILHCHDELSWFYGAPAMWLAGRGHVIMTIHGRRLDMSRRHRWEQRLLAGLTDRVVTVSAHLRDRLVDEIAVPANSIVVIRNGISAPRIPGDPLARRCARALLGVPADATVVGSVGRLWPVKNFGLLLEAIAEARRALPSLRLVLVGEGPSHGALVERATALGLAAAVTFTGLRRDVAALLPAFDIYACSSDYEGVSISLLEAMAAACPIVATAVGGNPEVVRPEETGVLVPPGDRGAMSRAILGLATDASRRNRLGTRARETVAQEFGLDRMLGDYDRLYRSLWR